MTEEIIKECKNCDALGIDSEIGVYYCCLSHRQDDLPKEFTCNDFTPNKQLKRLGQERDELKKACEKCKLFDIEKTNRDLFERIDKLKQERDELKENYKEDHAELLMARSEIEGLKSNLEAFARRADFAGKENDKLKQENKELKEKYSHVLELAKTNADSNEYCLQELEKKCEQLRSALEEILESAKFSQCLPCGSGNLEDCLNCNDDTTNNG